MLQLLDESLLIENSDQLFFPAPTFTLEDQIEHKSALLEKLVPRNAQLTLIGHSIGCKICMEVFRRNSTHAIKGTT